MGITFKAEIKKTEQREDRTWNIKIRETKGLDITRISTNFYVTKSYFSRNGFRYIEILPGYNRWFPGNN